MRSGHWAMNMTIHGEADANGVFTNMPAAATFLFSSYRHVQLVDLDGFSIVRLKVNKQSTAGQAGAKLILRFNETFSTTAGNYRDVGVSEVSVAIDTTNTYLDSGWIDLHPDANGEVFIAVIGEGGNGTLDPAFGHISVAFA